MPIQLIAAYVIFSLTPLGLAFSIALRRRRVERALREMAED